MGKSQSYVWYYLFIFSSLTDVSTFEIFEASLIWKIYDNCADDMYLFKI